MSEKPEVVQQVQQRFYSLLIGLEEAQEVAGVETENVSFDETEQGDARRELLRVEKIAKRDKDLNKAYEDNFVEGIREKIHQEMQRRFVVAIEDEELIYDKLLGVPDAFPEVLDTLSTKAASISRIEPKVVEVPWLVNDLMKMVNMPKYRRTDRKGKAIQVESIRMGLSFFGLENLKKVMPSMALRRWIPQITDPYPQIKHRIWQQAMGNALSCQCIAAVSELDQGHAFTLGMLHEVGKIVVVKLYFRLFDEVMRDAMIEAENERQREEHAALSKITVSSVFLTQWLREYSLPISAKVIRKMGMKRVFIANAMDEFCQDVPLAQMSPMGQVLAQGNAYNKYRMLKQYKLINVDESKDYLRHFQFPAGALAALRTTDLRKLNLSFDEE